MSAPATTALMRRALRAAAQGPAADPNPRVGAVVVDRAGAVVGEGHHAGAGTPHAEVVALTHAGDRAAGGTAYITLEPCSHTGRTPPCTQALLASGIGKVVYAVPDPSAQAAGGGVWLAEHGVPVAHGRAVLPAAVVREATELVQAWSFAVRHGRPRVIWKLAATLDGRSAAADGSSAWITSPPARLDVHRMRSECGAIVVGTGTALADDPALTARLPDGSLRERQPLRVVVGHRRLPETARLRDDTAETLALGTHDPAQVLAALHEREVRQVLLEGGPHLAAAFWRAELVDEVVAYLAPALLGAGASAVADLGIGSMPDIARLEITDLVRVGPDVRITAHRLAQDPVDSQPLSGQHHATSTAGEES